MDSYKRQLIEAKAQELLSETGISALPVKLIELAEKLEIQVHAKPASSDGASGWLVKSGDDFAIIYATNIESQGFQNFSIAHEIGHFSLEGHPEHVFRNGGEHASRAGFTSSDPIEREADYFASCLLMPKVLVKPLINGRDDGLIAVKALANACDTSLVAAALRYAEIGHLPVGVIQCKEGRVEFCAMHMLQAHVGWARSIPKNQKVPEDSATRRLSQDRDAVIRSGEDSDCLSASDWFSGAKGNCNLIEEVVGLGKFGRTLTLLYPEDEDLEDQEENDRWDSPRFR